MRLRKFLICLWGLLAEIITANQPGFAKDGFILGAHHADGISGNRCPIGLVLFWPSFAGYLAYEGGRVTQRIHKSYFADKLARN